MPKPETSPTKKPKQKPIASGRTVYVVTYQFGTDAEVVAVKSTKQAAFAWAYANAETAIIMLDFPEARVSLRGDKPGVEEWWFDLVEGDILEPETLQPALYTVNRMKVDGPTG